MTTTTVKPRPFKKFFCDRPEAFLLPPAAFKIWMYHYARENADRKSWPSIETLMKKCKLGRKAVYRWRSWLQRNGWLVKTGEIRGRNHGEFGVPIFTVKRGTIPSSRHPKSGSRLTHPPSPQKDNTDAWSKGSLEVDSELQVDYVPPSLVVAREMKEWRLARRRQKATTSLAGRKVIAVPAEERRKPEGQKLSAIASLETG
jgi:hypothetical protein